MKEKKDIKSFYHLHICKTGGRWLRQGILYPLEYQFLHRGISVIGDRKALHLGWDKDIDSNTFILSAMREPVSQICSLWTHNITTLGKHGQEDLKELFLSDIKHENIQLILRNNQSKHLYYEQEIEGWGEYLKDSGPVYIKTCIDRLRRIDYLYTIDGHQISSDKILEDLCSYFGFNLDDVKKRMSDAPRLSNESSQVLYESLSETEKNNVIDLLADIDYELYNIAIKESSYNV